jgi:SIR2-like domain
VINWDGEIVEALARRRAVLFLGSGVSRNSRNAAGNRPPLWKAVLEEGIAQCPAPQRELRRLLKSGDYLSCCQLIKYKMGHRWIPFLERTFSTPNFLHHEIHEHIFNLDAPVTLTPNFDRIYDNYAISAGGNKVKIKKYYDGDIGRALRGNADLRLVLKVHGCIDTPDKLIFTREDYADIRASHESFYRAIEALIMTNTLIFIGCGIGDPDISLLLEQYARSFANSPPHYFITPSKPSQDYAKLLKDNYNLVCVDYSNRNEHEELVESIAALVDLVDDSRSELAKTLLW